MNRQIRNGITVIARDYNEIYHSLGEYTIQGLFDEMTKRLADMLEGDNSNFDRDRFYSVVYRRERKYAVSP